jgi:hypothetical protein
VLRRNSTDEPIDPGDGPLQSFVVEEVRGCVRDLVRRPVEALGAAGRVQGITDRNLVRGGPDVTGVVTLKANITAARVRVVGRRTFAIGRTQRATVRVKLKRPAIRQLRRKRRLRLSTRVVLRNAAGLRSATSGRITLRLRRR